MDLEVIKPSLLISCIQLNAVNILTWLLLLFVIKHLKYMLGIHFF